MLNLPSCRVPQDAAGYATTQKVPSTSGRQASSATIRAAKSVMNGRDIVDIVIMQYTIATSTESKVATNRIKKTEMKPS